MKRVTGSKEQTTSIPDVLADNTTNYKPPTMKKILHHKEYATVIPDVLADKTTLYRPAS